MQVIGMCVGTLSYLCFSEENRATLLASGVAEALLPIANSQSQEHKCGTSAVERGGWATDSAASSDPLHRLLQMCNRAHAHTRTHTRTHAHTHTHTHTHAHAWLLSSTAFCSCRAIAWQVGACNAWRGRACRRRGKAPCACGLRHHRGEHHARAAGRTAAAAVPCRLQHVQHAAQR